MSPTAQESIVLEFDDNSRLATLCGEHNAHLARIEAQLGVEIAHRGNQLAIAGPAEAVGTARDSLHALWQRLALGLPVTAGEIDAAVRLGSSALDPSARQAALQAIGLPGSGRSTAPKGGGRPGAVARGVITPRTPAQATYMEALKAYPLVFGIGPAGTGKTFLAVAEGVQRLMQGEVERLIISRPAVEAGERLGFLPGDLKDKVDPYMRPIYDSLYALMGADRVNKRLETGVIEVAPIAFMRGRTLQNAYVILDEAQNTTPMQMRMFLTRLGEHSAMAVTGDPTQIDLPAGTESGLIDALDILKGVDDIAVCHFAAEDVIRHKLVGDIVRAYERAAQRSRATRPTSASRQ